MRYRGIFQQIKLFVIIEYQRIVTLIHKEVIHLPLLFGYHLLLITVNDREGEFYSALLHLLIDDKIKEEIIKEFIGCPWHHRLSGENLNGVSYSHSQRVNRISRSLFISIGSLVALT